MKIDRLFSILMMIINKEKVTAKELSEHFQVSVRTIQRDIDTLCMAGIPIYAEVGQQGGYQLLDNYRLDKSFLNTNEAKMLSSLLDGLQQSVPYQEVKSVSDKFSMMTSKQPEDNKLVVKLNPLTNQENFKKYLDIIAKARDNYQKVNIKYMDINLKESYRIICPYTLVMLGSTWYIYAYCELRKDFRMFKLSRIVACDLMDEEFVVRELPNPLPWENDLASGRECTKITLEIDRALQGKLPDCIEYKNCKIEKDKIIVSLYFPVDEWLYSLLCGLVPHVKIIEPAWLREEFIKRLNFAIEKNKL